MEISRGLGPDGTSPALLRALEAGVTVIDTARAYGGSEGVVGRTLRAFGGPAPFLATKVAPLPTGDWRHYIPLERAFTPQSIRESVETSLRELGVERIDLLQLHQWYYLWTHRPEWLETFRELRDEGKIRFFGISAQDHEHDAVLQVVDAWLIDTVQLVYNVFESRPLTSLFPLARERNVGVIARCVLDHGGLSGALTDEQVRAHRPLRRGPADEYLRRVARLKVDFGVGTGGYGSLAELAIRFALTDPAVSTLTLSMPTPEIVAENVAAAGKGPLPAEEFDRIQRRYSWFKNFWVASAFDDEEQQ
jgi:aryl-alcohol dehydrogenase-like predicted oxidoreductase